MSCTPSSWTAPAGAEDHALPRASSEKWTDQIRWCPCFANIHRCSLHVERATSDNAPGLGPEIGPLDSESPTLPLQPSLSWSP